MKLRTLLAASAAMLALSGAASAATIVSLTEGNRAQVVGSTPVADSGTGNDISLGTIGGGDSSFAYGAVAAGVDDFSFTTTQMVSTVNFVFDDLPLVNTGTETRTGLFTADNPATPKDLTFQLFSLGTTTSLLGERTFTGDVLDPSANGGTDLVFGGIAAGDYRLRLFGNGDARSTRYDISVNGVADTMSPIPLPATALLLLGAVGGLGFAARRKKA